MKILPFENNVHFEGEFCCHIARPKVLESIHSDQVEFQHLSFRWVSNRKNIQTWTHFFGSFSRAPYGFLFEDFDAILHKR